MQVPFSSKRHFFYLTYYRAQNGRKYSFILKVHWNPLAIAVLLKGLCSSQEVKVRGRAAYTPLLYVLEVGKNSRQHHCLEGNA